LCRAPQRDLRIGAAGRIEGTSKQVPQVNDQVGRLCTQVCQHGFQSKQVAVRISEDGDAHQPSPWPGLFGPPTCLAGS
jgi:hypothetical protein